MCIRTPSARTEFCRPFPPPSPFFFFNDGEPGQHAKTVVLSAPDVWFQEVWFQLCPPFHDVPLPDVPFPDVELELCKPFCIAF